MIAHSETMSRTGKQNILRESSVVSVWILIAACFAVWYFVGFSPIGWGINPASVEVEPYRLITYMFTHASTLHLAGNMISLYLIGSAYSSKRGNLSTLLVFIAGGVFAGGASCMWKLVNGGITLNQSLLNMGDPTFTYGASGATFALLGAHWVIMLKEGAPMRRLLPQVLVVLFLNFIGTYIDVACNLGGFLAGTGLEFLIEVHYDRKALNDAN